MPRTEKVKRTKQISPLQYKTFISSSIQNMQFHNHNQTTVCSAHTDRITIVNESSEIRCGKKIVYNQTEEVVPSKF